MIRQEYKCNFEKCRHNVHGKCCRLRFDLCKYYKAKEIIEKLLNAFASNDFFEEEELNAMAEAEQFLK